MGCLTLKVEAKKPSSVEVQPVRPSSVHVSAHAPSVLTVRVLPPSSVRVSAVPHSHVDVTPAPPSKLSIGNVCSVGSGEIYVLAASDGPLRTIDGGFLLLDPEGEGD